MSAIDPLYRWNRKPSVVYESDYSKLQKATPEDRVKISRRRRLEYERDLREHTKEVWE